VKGVNEECLFLDNDDIFEYEVHIKPLDPTFCFFDKKPDQDYTTENPVASLNYPNTPPK
jgi:hypothetical protein